MLVPKKVLHWVLNQEEVSVDGRFFDKFNPVTGKILAEVARGSVSDIESAVQAAVHALENWKKTPVVKRGEILRQATLIVRDRVEEISQIISLETGKSLKDARGEVSAAVEMGFFISGEGRRFYGRTTTSAVSNRTAMTVRQPIGVAGLIIAANTPIANVAWKVFPALLCGNTAILKPSEDAPYTALWFAKILKEAGLPSGVLSIVQGLGEEAGDALVKHSKVGLLSFTGSVPVGKYIQKTTSDRLAKVCLELGGKNALIVCDDADLEAAASDAVLSSFSNAGQRCASSSRIIIFESVYEEFKKIFLGKVKKLTLGPEDINDLGPVINEGQLNTMLNSIAEAKNNGAEILAGGVRLEDSEHKDGYYLLPTVFENVSPDALISHHESFGPITCLYKVKNFNEAVELSNSTSFGLTAALHTTNMHRIQEFIELSQTGVVSINGPTHGSEPHMPFGGLKDSGNGFREAGTEVLDVFSDWKTIYIKHNPNKI